MQAKVCVGSPGDHIFFFFGYLGSTCMYVLFVTNPAVAAKSNKPLLLHLFQKTTHEDKQNVF